MSSASFENFQRQLHSTGRSHGEGYSSTYFVGMSEEEQSKAVALLRHAALGGDATAIDGLRYLVNAQTTEALREVVSRSVVDVMTVKEAAALYERNGDEYMVGLILNGVGSSDRFVSWHSLQSLPDNELDSPGMTKKASEVLSSFVLQEDDLVRRHMAAKKLLKFLGLSNDPRHREIVLGLANESLQIRRSTLDLIEAK